MVYKPFEDDSINYLESLNLGLMAFIALFLTITFAEWNVFVTWVLFVSSLLVPLLIYFYLGVKYLFDEKFEEKQDKSKEKKAKESCCSTAKVIYSIRKRLNIKYKQLGGEDGIDDSQNNFVSS